VQPAVTVLRPTSDTPPCAARGASVVWFRRAVTTRIFANSLPAPGGLLGPPRWQMNEQRTNRGMGTGIPCTYISYARRIGNALFRDRGWMSFEKNLIIPRIQNFKVDTLCRRQQTAALSSLCPLSISLPSMNYRRKWKAMSPNLSLLSRSVVISKNQRAGESPTWGCFFYQAERRSSSITRQWDPYYYY